MQCNGHFLLARLCLGLNGNRNDRLREYHGFQNQRMPGIGQSIPGGCFPETYRGSYVSGIHFGYFLPVIGMHHQYPAYSFLFILCRIINIGPGFEGSRIHPEKGKLAHVGVGHNFESQRRKGLIVGGMSFLALVTVGQHSLDCLHIRRRWQVSHYGVQQQLNPLVPVRGPAQYRDYLNIQRRCPKSPYYVFPGDILSLKVFFQKAVIKVGHGFKHAVPVFLGQFRHVLGDGLFLALCAQVVHVVHGLHGNQVHNALETVLLANGQLYRHRVCPQPFSHHFHHIEEIGPGYVHFVYICNPRNIILVRLAPYCLGLGLHSALCAKNRYRTIKDTQGPFHLNSEIHMPWRIDDVYSMALPVCSSSSGSNGNPPLLFLLHPVHSGGAVMHFSHPVQPPGVKQDTLGSRGFPCINMCHYSDVSYFFYGKFSRHLSTPFGRP